MTPNAIDKAIAALERIKTAQTDIWDQRVTIYDLEPFPDYIEEALTSLKALKESVEHRSALTQGASVTEAKEMYTRQCADFGAQQESVGDVRKSAIEHAANVYSIGDGGYVLMDIFSNSKPVMAVQVADRMWDYLSERGLLQTQHRGEGE